MTIHIDFCCAPITVWTTDCQPLVAPRHQNVQPTWLDKIRLIPYSKLNQLPKADHAVIGRVQNDVDAP